MKNEDSQNGHKSVDVSIRVSTDTAASPLSRMEKGAYVGDKLPAAQTLPLQNQVNTPPPEGEGALTTNKKD